MNSLMMIVLGFGLSGIMADGKDRPVLTSSPHDILVGGEVGAAKAARDTTYLLGGPGTLSGKFEDQFGNADWQGWTHVDLTAPPAITNWHVDTFNIPAGGGTYAIWCGQRDYPNACDDGYGNAWADNLVFTYTVPNPSVGTTVRLECIYNSDSEPGYDFFRIQQNRGGTWDNLANLDGVHVGETFDQTVTFTPEDYAGPSGTQVQLRFQGASDGGWSDEDCLYDSEGLAQVDNIRVTIGDDVWYEDHEDGDNDHWVWQPATGVGDFAQIWQGLQDIDPCVSNLSPQVAFIDDGVVVPGTGGTSCITWCYGPNGYIVNNTGGLLGPDFHLQNLVISPVLEWPDGNDGAILAFSVFHQEPLTPGVSPGILFMAFVRSAVDPEDLANAGWSGTGAVYYGLGVYDEWEYPMTNSLEPGRTVVQIGLFCVEYGWVWGYDGVDGTPTPYFDNVRFKVFPYSAPSIWTWEWYLAQDSFPERGDIDLANLADNWVRFDSGFDYMPDSPAVDPGDSILVNIELPRAGAVLTGLPKMVVKMKANSLFDSVRVLPANFTQSGDFIEGWVYGDSVLGINGEFYGGYSFDLPDSTFFFPGDVIHYYIEAQDDVNGDIGTATLPADISAVSEFDGLFPYGGNDSFIVRGLPSLFDPVGNQPRILFWMDCAGYPGGREWVFALNNLGYNEHVDYDLYYTNAPSANESNGLGGRATSQTIGGYDVLLYAGGSLVNTILEARDIDVLSNWFQQGGKKAFMTADDLVFCLSNSGGEALNFLNTYLSADLVSDNILPMIDNQAAPTVVPVVGNSVFATADSWIAYGGCPTIRDFDAVEPSGAAERLAQFLTPSGFPGYSYSAAQRYTDVADVIYMPYEFSFINTPDDYVPGQTVYPARTEVLRDILIAFGHLPGGDVIGVPASDVVFGVSSYPNPFNPTTEIKLTLPHAGRVSLKIFNVRGELARTLVDGDLTAGVQKVTWNGTDDAGRQVGSGVYFTESRYDGEIAINKIALVR